LGHPHSVSSYTDHKLVNFNVPKYLIKNFDNLVKFKRISRTSMLIHLMENYIRVEKKRMEDDNSLNLMINDVELRNRETFKTKLVKFHKEVEKETEPPMIPMTNDQRESWEERLTDDHSKDDWSDPSGLNRLWKL